MGKKVLVTGGAGFIGSFLVDKLVERGYDVTIFDNLEQQVHSKGVPDYINKKAKFVKGDMRDYNLLKDSVIKSDVIFNLAARVGIGQSMYDIKDYVKTNELGTANLLHALANENHSVKKILLASSMTIYGEGAYFCGSCNKEHYPKERNIEQLRKKQWELLCSGCGSDMRPIATKETKPLSRSSIYAITKKNQEELTLNVGRTYGIPAVALRFFNVYGPRQSLSNPYTGVAAIFISRMKNNNFPIIFEDGNQSRDFVSVHDVVNACVLAMENKNANGEIFNIGSGKNTSINHVALSIQKSLDSEMHPKITNEPRKMDIRHCFADISKIKSKLGYEPKISFEAGINKLVEWSKTQAAEDTADAAYGELKKKKLI